MSPLRFALIGTACLIGAALPSFGQPYQPYTFWVLAGSSGQAGNADGVGSAARFEEPWGVAVDANGNVYVADTGNDEIRKISTDGLITTLAGSVSSNGDLDGTGSGGHLSGPRSIAIDGAGNLYVSEIFGETIRKVTPSGVVTTLAGSYGNSGSADGPGSAARFFSPMGVAVDSSGNVYVADSRNYTVRKILANGTVSTLAGSPGVQGSADGTGSAAQFTSPNSVAVDAAGNVYVADVGTIRKISPLGVVTTLAGSPNIQTFADGTGSAARFEGPTYLAMDPSGNLLVDDSGYIRRVTPGGVVTTIGTSASTAALFPSGNGFGSIAVDSNGAAYLALTGLDVIEKGIPLSGSAAPQITSPLTTIPAIAGQSLSYQITATNNPAAYNATNLPPGLTIDYTTGLISGVTPASAAGNFYAVQLSASNAAGTGSATLTIALSNAAPVIESPSTALAILTQSFTYQISASGSPISFFATGLPAWASVNTSTGVISGLPTATGTFVATISATNAAGTGSATLTLTVSATLPTPTITSSTIASATVGQPFNFQITASPAPTSYSATGLPTWASLNSSTGVISGTPTTIATYLVTLSAINTSGTGTASMTIEVYPASPVITSTSAATATVGLSFSYQITATNNPESYNATNLPAGLAVNFTTGLISGVPSANAAGTPYQVQLSATNSGGTGSGILVIAVQSAPPPPLVTSGLVSVAWVGQPFSYQLQATNGPTSYGATGLPAGLTINAATGLITGTPSGATGAYNVQLTAANATGSGNAVLVLTVASSSQSTYNPFTLVTYAGQPNAGSTDGSTGAAQFNGPRGVAVDKNGNLYVADTGNATIRLIGAAGTVTTLAGMPGQVGSNDGAGAAARFDNPTAVAVDLSGNLYVADTGNDTVRKITAGGLVSTLAGASGAAGSLDGNSGAARFNGPSGVAADANGNVYVADTGNDTIRKIDSNGNVTTLAGSASSFGSADGTGSAARFFGPSGMAIDSNGNLFVADNLNELVRRVTPTGVVTTLAGTAGSPGSSDGAGSAARFNAPASVALDSGGNIYVADAGNDTIREITSAGNVTTLAGAPGIAGSQDGSGSTVRLNNPGGIAVGVTNEVYVADTGNNLIRWGVAAGSSPVITAQPQSTSILVGGTCSLSVSASGVGTLTYQWFLNGGALAGQTGTTFTKANAQASDAGTYTVKVSDAVGSVTSSPATVSVAQSASGGAGGGGGGGGGAPSYWFLGALALTYAAKARRLSRRQPSGA